MSLCRSHEVFLLESLCFSGCSALTLHPVNPTTSKPRGGVECSRQWAKWDWVNKAWMFLQKNVKRKRAWTLSPNTTTLHLFTAHLDPQGASCAMKKVFTCALRLSFSILSLLHHFSWKQTHRRSPPVSFPVAVSVCQTRPRTCNMLPCYFQSRAISRSLFLSVRTKKCVKVPFEF